MLFLLSQSDYPVTNLSTTAGIIGASFVITEISKRFITTSTPVLGKIPVLSFPLVISLALVILSNKVFKTDAGRPFLEGNIWTLLINTLVAATSASGAYTWFRHGGTTVGESQPLGKTDKETGEDTTMKPNPLIILPLLMVLISGCAPCPQKAVLREAMDQGTRTIRADHKAWAQKLVAYPIGTTDPRTGKPSTGKNMADQIPPISPSTYEQILKTHQEYEDLVNQDRNSTN